MLKSSERRRKEEEMQKKSVEEQYSFWTFLSLRPPHGNRFLYCEQNLMKKPICKKGTQCQNWKKDLLHSVIFTHGSEVHEVLQPLQQKESDGSPPSKKRAVELPVDHTIKEFLEQKYLVTFPDEFLRFWELLTHFPVDQKDYCSAFKCLKNLRLVGPFQILLEKQALETLSYDNEYYLTAHRFSTDLPEMQTIAVYDGGRYVYWRDTPDSDSVLLVHVSHDTINFPKAEIIGDADPRWMIIHLCANEKGKHPLSRDKKSWMDLNKLYKQELNRIVKERKKHSYGQPFHGLGIVVEVNGDVGYRPLENPPPATLKKMLEDFVTCTDEKQKSELRESIMNCVTFVDIANDEMDFSLGLEVGHDLFWSNYKTLDRLTEVTLSNSYLLLKRNAFNEILTAHMKVRRADKALNY
uniref:Zf-CCHH domain-containing protein n=1 Tax=Syphacia muris TaxID=451379 RepID=A0A0N5ALE4_9BILA